LAVIYGLTSLALAIVCSDPDFDNKTYFSSIAINLALSYIVLYILYQQQHILLLYISFLLIGISSWVLIALTHKINFKAMLSLLPYGAWTTFTSYLAYFIFNN
jgi:tryptophan-rich sensory protein